MHCSCRDVRRIYINDVFCYVSFSFSLSFTLTSIVLMTGQLHTRVTSSLSLSLFFSLSFFLSLVSFASLYLFLAFSSLTLIFSLFLSSLFFLYIFPSSLPLFSSLYSIFLSRLCPFLPSNTDCVPNNLHVHCIRKLQKKLFIKPPFYYKTRKVFKSSSKKKNLLRAEAYICQPSVNQQQAKAFLIVFC